MIASGEVFGKDQPLELRLLGSEKSREALGGVAMELEDSLYPLLRSVKIGIDAMDVFKQCDWALLIGAKPRGPGMERSELLDMNGQIFETQGKALDAVRCLPNRTPIVVTIIMFYLCIQQPTGLSSAAPLTRNSLMTQTTCRCSLECCMHVDLDFISVLATCMFCSPCFKWCAVSVEAFYFCSAAG